MDRIFRFNLTLTSLITAILVSVGHELKQLAQSQSPAYSLVLIFFSLLIGILSAPIILKMLTNFTPFRRVLFGRSWIEGYWYNLSIEENASESTVSEPGITEISFKSTELGYETTGHRIRNGVDIFTFSQYVVIIGQNNLYINVANSNATTAFRHVIACGYFYRSPGSRMIDTYDGVIMYPDGAASFRQRARRIEPKLVRTLVKEHGGGWIKKYLSGELPSLNERNESIRSKKIGRSIRSSIGITRP